MRDRDRHDIPGSSEIQWEDEITLINDLAFTAINEVQGEPRYMRDIVERSIQDIKKHLDTAVCTYKNTVFVVITPGNRYYQDQVVSLIKSQRRRNTLIILNKPGGYRMYRYGEAIQEAFHKDRIQKFMDMYILKKLIKET